MEEITFVTRVENFADAAELPSQEGELIASSEEAMKRAYAPYSGFQVGAAVLLENGVVVQGNNQENMAYPSGLCAERVAIYHAGATYPGVKIKAVAISAGSDVLDVSHPVSPCGACRQAMLEYEMNQYDAITILMKGRTSQVFRVNGVKQLLPLFFNEQGLKQH
jgi:cytidine deaminase